MIRLFAETPFARNLGAIPVQQHREELAADLLQGLWRCRGLIVGTIAACLLGAALALLVLERHYTSETVVRLDFSKRDGGVAPGQTTALMMEAAALIQGEARLIRSRVFARRVVSKLGLAADIRHPVAPGLLGRLVRPRGALARRSAWLGLSDEPTEAQAAPPVDADTLRAELAVRGVMPGGWAQ